MKRKSAERHHVNKIREVIQHYSQQLQGEHEVKYSVLANGRGKLWSIWEYRWILCLRHQSTYLHTDREYSARQSCVAYEQRPACFEDALHPQAERKGASRMEWQLQPDSEINCAFESEEEESIMERLKLEEMEEYILAHFRMRATGRLLAKDVFDSTQEYANADLVRALEDLEKKKRLFVRYTNEGSDWIQLRPEGAKYAGIIAPEIVERPTIRPHPPKSST